VRGTLRTVAALSAIAMLAAACGSSGSSSTPSASPSSTPAGSSSSSPAAGGKFLACMVTDTGGVNDKSFNQSSYAGLTAAAAADPSITPKVLQSTSTSDYASNITAFLGQKCGIIVTVGFLMGAATQTAATANPSQKFAIVDFAYSPVISNVDALLFNTLQDGFLGGYLAAGMSKTGKVATFGGQKLSTVTIYMDGFADGVQYYNTKHHKSVQVLGWNEATQNGNFTNSFTNLTAGQQLHRDHGIEAGLPRDRAQPQVAPARLRIRHLVQEDLARPAVLDAGHPRAHHRPAAHGMPDGRRIGHQRRDHVAWRDQAALDANRRGAVQADGMERLQDADELVTQGVLERHPPGA